MSGRLFARWCQMGGGSTLAEFVGEERARERARRAWAKQAPLLEQADAAALARLQAGVAGAAFPLGGLYGGVTHAAYPLPGLASQLARLVGVQ